MYSRLTKLLKENHGGMTLTEMMASLVIMVIMTLIVMKILMTSSSVFHGLISTVESRNVMDSLCEIIREQVYCAQYLEIEGEEKDLGDGGQLLVFSEDGKVSLNGADLYGEAFYNTRSIYCQVHLPEDDENSDILDITLFLENHKGEALYSVRTVVRLINLGLYESGGISVEGELDDDGILNSRNRTICLHYAVPREEKLQEK